MRYSRSTAVFCVGVALAAIGLGFDLIFDRDAGTSAIEVSVPVLMAAWFLERRQH